jgi:hypothetical protein
MTSTPVAPLSDLPSGDDDRLLYLGAGPLVAVLIGFGLAPFRETTTAANLSFAFVILTIVVAAFGGRSAGVLTAFASSLSMDFFLTKPYLSLRMSSSQDVIAFLGLTACGVIAASLGSSDRIAALRELRAHTHLLHNGLRELEAAGPPEEELPRLLEATRYALPVRGLVVRDVHEHVVATAPPKYGLEPIPADVLEADSLLPRGSPTARVPRRPPTLPTDGARTALVTHKRQVGWLDLWGDGTPASTASRRTLSDMARVFAVVLARSGRP